MRSIRFLPGTDVELDAVIAWYREHRGADVAKRIMSELLHAMDRIALLPLAWPQSQTDPMTRVRHLPRIQYSVFYEVEPGWVTIKEIRHMRRGPDAWKPRR